MFCKYCGHQLSAQSIFCPGCGNRVDDPQQTPPQNRDTAPPQQTPPQQTSPQQTPPSSQQSGYRYGYGPQSGCGTPPNSPPAGGYVSSGVQSPQPSANYGAFPMNWYKFLVSFALFASCVSNVILGIMMMTGTLYGIAKAYVYRFYSAMQIVDLFIGAAMIGLAVLAIITRQKLARFKKDGPTFLLILYGACMVISILYLILTVSVIGEDLLIRQMIGPYAASLTASIVMMVVNNIYFKKRACLFVN